MTASQPRSASHFASFAEVADAIIFAARRAHALEKPDLRQAEVKTDDFRLELLHDIARRFIERSAIRARYGLARINAEFFVIGAEPLFPCGLSPSIEIWRRMGEEVQIDRLGRALPDHTKRRANLFRRRQRAGKRTKSACIRNGDGQLGRAGACHRCQQDRMLDLEQFDDCAIWPHRDCLHDPERRSLAGTGRRCPGPGSKRQPCATISFPQSTLSRRA